MKCMIPAVFMMLWLFSSCNRETVTAHYEIVPLPQQITLQNGDPFEINPSTMIVYPAGNEKLKKTAGFLSEYIRFAIGLSLNTTDQPKGKNAISLKTNFANTNREAYELIVDAQGVTINGSSDAGVFYGIQTLRKSIPVVDAQGKNILLPAVEITDYPRFAYRGMMLDVSRHFFPVEFVKQYIDILALHNLNRFHWHLTEDQGWRIEIKKYPRLTEVGSRRKETLVGSLYKEPHQYDGTPYGGFYTQDEIREVVQYAEERFITIIPEVDLPGHMLAALTAYPELGCTGGPYEVATKWGIFEDVLCVGNEETFDFLEGVFSEIVELFPSTYIHIGGDECPKSRWEVCPKCQARARELGIKGNKEHSVEEQLQSYCMGRVEQYLTGKGRKVIGWDEILEGGITPHATIMSWRGEEGGIAAARLHHDAIMVPHDILYFDYYQSEDRENEPLSIGGFNPVSKVYAYDPVPEVLDKEEKKHIIGLQANLWTEYIETEDHVEYMLLPRLAALSEVQWMQPEKKNYTDFVGRMSSLFQIYDRYGYNAARHIREE